MVLAGLVLSACGGGEGEAGDGSRLTAPVLWYGVQADGSMLSGTLDAIVDVRVGGAGSVVDVAGLVESGAGPVWAASAWTAATTALLWYGGVPDGLTVTVQVADRIDGPSAGGLVSLTTLAALSGVPLRSGVSMTGAIHPNGAVGPVAGVPEKLRAAAQAGLTTVVVPDSKREATDPRTQTRVDVQELADELGIEVVFARSLPDARAVLLDEPTSERATHASAPAPAPPAVPDVVIRAASRLALRLSGLQVADAPMPEASADGEQLRAVLAAVQGLPLRDVRSPDLLADFAVASETEAMVSVWNAEVDVIELALRQGVEAAVDRLRQQAADVTREANTALVGVAGEPVDTIEALLARVDVAEWATDALETAAAVTAVLDDPPRSARELGVLAGRLAAQRHHLEHTLPLQLERSRAVGGLPLTSSTFAHVEVFTSVLSQAAEANEALLDATTEEFGVTLTDELDEARVANDVTAEAVARMDTPTAKAIVRLADAASRYVWSATALNLDRIVTSDDSLLQRLHLLDPAVLEQQVELALRLSDEASSLLRSRNADVAYFDAEAVEAAALASMDDERLVTVDERLDGLRRLWFANINERIAVALTAHL